MTTPANGATEIETDRDGLSLAPFRATRPTVGPDRIATLLCPPYDVIDATTRARLLATDPVNAVAAILPEPTPEGYQAAARRIQGWLDSGVYGVDEHVALYVYEMRDDSGSATRGLLGAVELRAAEDGVILPHENTMAGPVADRLEVMTATDADLEPIYLVYDGGGAASAAVRDVDRTDPVATATTPDGITHRLWVLDDTAVEAVTTDLAGRRALIADGHHRYATYLERQRRRRATDGDGPWDRGLALIVDSTDYGPQVHAIHRVIVGLPLAEAIERLRDAAEVSEVDESPQTALDGLAAGGAFTAVLADAGTTYVVSDPAHTVARAAHREGEIAALSDLDVTVLHRGLVEQIWGLADDVETVRYAHSVDETLDSARDHGGFAVLLRPTPVDAVAAVAAAGARMPRKSTLFTPKPASGLVLRRLGDQSG